MRFVSCCWVLFAMVVLPSACMEMPIYRVEKTENPIEQPDGGEDGGIDPAAACRVCLAAPEDPGPGCKTPYDACVANGMCKTMIECAFTEHCLLGPRREFLGCALPCLTKAGVSTMDDKILETASSLFQCLANGPCGNLCFSD